MFLGIPLIPCLIYAILRIFYDNSMCWAEPSSDAYVEWIYMSLGLACIVANSFFFFNIFRILVTKLQAPHANEPAHFRYVFFVRIYFICTAKFQTFSDCGGIW